MWSPRFVCYKRDKADEKSVGSGYWQRIKCDCSSWTDEIKQWALQRHTEPCTKCALKLSAALLHNTQHIFILSHFSTLSHEPNEEKPNSCWIPHIIKTNRCCWPMEQDLWDTKPSALLCILINNLSIYKRRRASELGVGAVVESHNSGAGISKIQGSNPSANLQATSVTLWEGDKTIMPCRFAHRLD